MNDERLRLEVIAIVRTLFGLSVEEAVTALDSFRERFPAGIAWQTIRNALSDNLIGLTDGQLRITAYFTPIDWNDVIQTLTPPRKNPCVGCGYYCGEIHRSRQLICAVHPTGFDGDVCPDWAK